MDCVTGPKNISKHLFYSSPTQGELSWYFLLTFSFFHTVIKDNKYRVTRTNGRLHLFRYQLLNYLFYSLQKYSPIPCSYVHLSFSDFRGGDGTVSRRDLPGNVLGPTERDQLVSVVGLETHLSIP